MIGMVLMLLALTGLMSPNFEIKEVIYYVTILNENLKYSFISIIYYFVIFCTIWIFVKRIV